MARFHQWIAFLAAMMPLIASGRDAEPATAPAIGLLPVGSTLQRVILPRYDAERRLLSALVAKEVKILEGRRIQGREVVVSQFHPEGGERGKVELALAMYHQDDGLLKAKGLVRMHYDRLAATGSGLTYRLSVGHGFLHGPVQTCIRWPQGKVSQRSSSARQPAKGSPWLVAASVASWLCALPPFAVTPEELAAAERAAESRADELTALAKASAKALELERMRGEHAAAQARRFARKEFGRSVAATAITPVQASKPQAVLAPPPDAGRAHEPSAAPLEVPAAGPQETRIRCEGGMYYSAEEGVLVYLDNVVVSDPRFDLQGVDELKVFFKKKAPAKDADPARESSVPSPEPEAAHDKATNNSSASSLLPIGPASHFDDIDKLVATGAVVFKQRAMDGKEPIEASGRLLTYDAASGTVLISGGYPWVRQGTFFARAKQPNLTLRMLKDGSFSTQGNWEMGGKLELNR